MVDRAFAPDRFHPGLREAPPSFRSALRSFGLPLDLMVQAQEVADLPPGMDPKARRTLFALLLALRVAEAQGDVSMSRTPSCDEPAWAFLEACGYGERDVEALLDHPALQALLGPPGASTPLILEDTRLYVHRLHRAEVRLADALRTLADAPPRSVTRPPEALFTDPVALSTEQRQAVMMALERPLALITGGPGTGKTSIVVALLRALAYQPNFELERCALAAPTGKAAQRMGEAIRHALAVLRNPSPDDQRLLTHLPEPSTLHRCLGWNPHLGRFAFGAARPLEVDTLIVDEGSMVSLELMDRLLQALPRGARLVILGDADQLPSVEAGCVFRDLVQARPTCVQRLTESYRMRRSDAEGRQVLQAAQAIHRGETSGPDLGLLRNSVADLRFEGVERQDSPDPQPCLRRWFETFLDQEPTLRSGATRTYPEDPAKWSMDDHRAFAELVQGLERSRILCLLRDSGRLDAVEGINALFHAWMEPLTGQGLEHQPTFYLGEPVLMTANDYDRNLFNGDIGVILRVSTPSGEAHQAAVFPASGNPRIFAVEALKSQLQLCHAMTVHKAQGSEFERVLVVLPPVDHPALTREALYTALTRARRSATLLGSTKALMQAIQRKGQRASKLRERLRTPIIPLETPSEPAEPQRLRP